MMSVFTGQDNTVYIKKLFLTNIGDLDHDGTIKLQCVFGDSKFLK